MIEAKYSKSDLKEEKKKLNRLRMELFIRSTRKTFINFCKYCWIGPTPFKTGPHLEGAAIEIDIAIDQFLQGRDVFLLIAMPFRHGKSSMISRLLPAYFLARCHEKEPSVLLSGYGASLVLDASQDCRRIISSNRFDNSFPDTKLDPKCNRVDNWRIDKSSGRIVSVGLGGALAGRGYHLGILDDYCKNREEAESQHYRNSTWQSFSNDFLTRRMSPSITIVMATPWHVDDIRGRIITSMKKNKDFPQFKNIVYPARNPDGSFLWESFLGREWYLSHYATLTPYESASILDCDPDIKTGGMFNVEGLKKISVNSIKIEDVVKAVRYWDKAGTHLGGCFTAGVLMLKMKDKRYIVYDVSRGQWDTNERETKIKEVSEIDKEMFGSIYKIGIEQEPGSGGVDSAKFTVQNLPGFTVLVDKVTGSKETRANPWSSQINGGNVSIVDALWNQAFIEEHTSFPAGKTKDIVDAASGAFNKLFFVGTSGSGGIIHPRSTF